MTAFYNEIDPFAAAWLRELVAQDQIAGGTVDDSDIRKIDPVSLAPFTQCHFFAGIGGWSYALRLAGWPDDVSVWTGSCPCQPFSSAGKRGGFDDDRHLWPAWFRLIRECRPAIIFGEQVASPDGLEWFDTVSTELENEGYATGAADLCAAGVGAPHKRQRLYFVAYASGERFRRLGLRLLGRGPLEDRTEAPRGGEVGAVANVYGGPGGQGGALADRSDPRGDAEPRAGSGSGGGAGRLGDADRISGGRDGRAVPSAQGADEGMRRVAHGSRDAGQNVVPATFWSNAQWIDCLDGKARPIEPGTFPLAPRLPGDVGRLRGYGNSIVPQDGALFIQAAVEAMTLPAEKEAR